MKWNLWKDSIKTRVTLSALVVFLLSLWVLAFLITRILERDISQLVADAQASAVTQVASQIDRELKSRLVALEQIAARINTEMIDSPNAVQQLLEAQPLLQNLFNVSVLATNSAGTGIADVPYNKERIGINYRGRVDAVDIALDKGRAHIGRPIIGISTGQPLIPFAVPVRDDNGAVIGALGGAIDLSQPNFFDDLTAQGYGRTGTYSVVSKSRRIVVTSSNHDLIMLELPPSGINPVLDRALQGEEGTGRYTTVQGIDSLATVRGLKTTDWLVAAITPATEAFAPIKDVQQRMRLMILLVSPLMGLIIWWILLRQLRPMFSTVEVLGQMTESDQSLTNLSLTGKKEIDKLISAFNRLLGALGEREQENRRFRTISDNAVYGKAIADLEGNLIYVNRFFAELHGYHSEELIGKNLSIFHSPEQLEQVIMENRSLLQKGYFSPREIWHVHREGRVFPMLMSGLLLKDDQGNPEYMAASAVDITDRKDAEMALQKKNQELEQFVYSVSHDLKSPLITVRTYTGILRQSLRANDDSQINKDLDYIDTAANKMQQLLDALLQYSRIGKTDTQTQTLTAHQLVNNSLDTLAGILRESQVEVSTSELSQQLHGDPMHFGQIWQNLIENAIKYMGDQPQPHIKIGATQDGQEVVFYVRDNGMGIAPEHRERIFNLFSQLHPGSDGSGLGLALVKKVVSIYQGHIWVESAGEGQGSCFMFTLPGALILFES